MRHASAQLSGSFLLAAVLGAAACGGDEMTPSATTGALEVTASTTGVEPDSDGFTVQMDAEPPQALSPGGSVQRGALAPGSHTIQLAGIAANCADGGENPRSDSVAAGKTETVTFVVNCAATTGNLAVSSSTSGPSPDPDGYTITLDGTDHGVLQGSADITLEGIAGGDHLVGLSGVAGNCEVQGENPRRVTLTAGERATIAFVVVCTPPSPTAGNLRIVTATTGADPDPDGYAFAVDGGTTQPISVNATAALSNVVTGAHSVRLSRVAGNCTVQGANPRSVTVTTGATTQVRFAVSCSATTGTIRVSVTSSGSPPDPDGYILQLEGTGQSQAVETSGSASFTGLPAGNHTVSLMSMATNCSDAQGASRSVTVTAGNTAEVSFAVTCTTTTGSVKITTTTSGEDPDRDGYTVTLDASDRGTIPVNAEKTIDGVAAGSHTVGLSGVASNCTVEGENPRTLDVTVGTVAEAAFTVACTTRSFDWTTMVDAGVYDLRDVWGTSSSDVFAVGGQQVVHYDGTGWTEQFRITESVGRDAWALPGGLRGVWASSPTDVFAVGGSFGGGVLESPYALILHYDGAGWAEMTRFARDGADFTTLNAVWGTSPSDVFAVGAEEHENSSSTLIAHYDGTAWTPMAVPDNAADLGLYDVWGTSGDNVYAVGINGLNNPGGLSGAVLRYDGTAWAKVLEVKDPMVAVWGSGPTDVFVATAFDNFWHHDGTNWTPMTTPSRDRENTWGIWGVAPNDVYAVGGAYAFPDGRRGAVHHYDGTSWEEQTGGAAAPLYSVWGSSATDVFAVGGVILRGTGPANMALSGLSRARPGAR
jgi:hypothetical protein